jgi:hypothetical protein
MSSNISKSASPILAKNGPRERHNLRVQAMKMWMSAANGGRRPGPGQQDKAVDWLMESINNITLDSLKARVSPASQGKSATCCDLLTEAELKSLVAQAAKISVEDHDAKLPPVAYEAPKPKLNIFSEPVQPEAERRCWTNGTSFCSCTSTYRATDGLFDDGLDVVCGFDCPVGYSQEELAEAARRQATERYSPCCGEEECVCTTGGDRAVRVCNICGERSSVCVTGTVKHEYDPFCMRSDCTCRNQLPRKEDIIMSTIGERVVKEEDVTMADMDE